MVHVARRLFGAFVVLAIVAGATLALSSRPRLETDRSAVERRWRAVEPGLNTRYGLVDALARVIAAAPGPANTIVDDVNTAVAHWRVVRVSAGVATAIGAANALEGLARRLDATVTGSPLLRVNKTVTDAQHALAVQPVPTGVDALNAAVDKFEKDRGGPLRRIVAGPMGYNAIPRLALDTGD
jgi:hypothetical protein